MFNEGLYIFFFSTGNFFFLFFFNSGYWIVFFVRWSEELGGTGGRGVRVVSRGLGYLFYVEYRM